MSLRIALNALKEARRFSALMIATAILIAALSVVHGHAATPSQKTFKSPEDAVNAMMAALKTKNRAALRAIFGAGSQGLVSSGDEAADNAASEQFVSRYEERNRLERVDTKTVILYIGNDEWPFPIPVVMTGNKWRFDTKAGKHEVLARRIGRNETGAIQTCLVYVDAQHEYARKDRNTNGLLEYAQKFASEPGKKDGLYWKANEGEEESPLGPLVASAVREGYTRRKTPDQPTPYHGYYFRILKAQGKNAPGGAYDYIVDGKMIGGFALIAYPAQYGNSGVMSFIVNQDGVVYQKNLGKNTTKIAQATETFDPDKTWKKVE